MVKRRTEIKKIEDKAKRDAAFRTGRKVLFKMAREFGQDFGAEVAVITIHEAGNVFAFGHPDLTSVVQHYKEAKEVESSKRDDDDQEVVQEVQYLSADDFDDFDETEESTDDDEDESNSDGKIKVKKGKSPFWKRDDDHQEVQYILGDQRNQSDQLDLSLSLSLPLRHNKVEENESSGMMIRNKSESGRGLAFDLLEGGSQKNGANQEEQYLRKEVKMQGLSTADSSMIPSSLRKLLRVVDLELDELEQLMAEMEEKKKRILDRANQIMAEMEDLELHELEQLMAEMKEIKKMILDPANQIMAEMEEIKKEILDRVSQVMKSSADPFGDSGKDSSM